MPKDKTGKKPEKKPEPKAAAKSAPPAAKPAAKPAEAEHHSSQAEVARKLYEKLHGAKAQGGAPGQNVPGQKKGFDPHSFHAQGKGARHNTMMRRTQSRGGGGGSGGGGGGGGGSGGA